MRATFVRLLFFLFLSLPLIINAQLKGEVRNENGIPISFVQIHIEGDTNITTTNSEGNFSLPTTKEGTYFVIFNHLDYQVKRVRVQIQKLPSNLEVVLNYPEASEVKNTETSLKLEADEIILKAIAKRKAHRKKIKKYSVELYSRQQRAVLGSPKKLLGLSVLEVPDEWDNPLLGTLGFAEQFSKIDKEGRRINETVIASERKGYLGPFEEVTAALKKISFYNKVVHLGKPLISPIAKSAFLYYNYELAGNFLDGKGRIIHKIKLLPKRRGAQAFSGYIYLVNESWSIYAVDLGFSGRQVGLATIDSLRLQEQYHFLHDEKLWVRTLQQLNGNFGDMGMEGKANYISQYQNYNFRNRSDQKKNNIELFVLNDAFNKETSYWNKNRPFPLTQKEISQNKILDSLLIEQMTEHYLDSVKFKLNHFDPKVFLLGYSYQKKPEEGKLTLGSPIQELRYNTVQGWNSKLVLDYSDSNTITNSQFSVKTIFDYGLSDRVLRPSAQIGYKSKANFTLSGGREITQFNSSIPISTISNSFRTLFLETNDAKFYDKTHISFAYGQEVVNGVQLKADLSYEWRRPVFNTADFFIIGDKDNTFTSNNPLAPQDFDNPAFFSHNLARLNLEARFQFGQKYQRYPQKKVNLSSFYPTLWLNYEGSFAASKRELNFNRLEVRLRQLFPISNRGYFGYHLKVGGFLDIYDTSFVDFKHFNGNRNRISTNKDYLNSFFVLPYYDFSTDNAYFEGHLEYDFRGYLLEKIPLLNLLNAHLILDAKLLSTSENQPYSEISVGLGNLGWNSFRFLRIDFAQSYIGGIKEQWLNFGIQF